MQAMPDVSKLIPDASTQNININYQTPADFLKDVDTFPGNFSAATWFGLILINNAGTYTFQTNSMAGAHLWIDGEMIVDDGDAHEAQVKTGQMILTAGYHHLKADWYANEGEFKMIVSSSGPDTLDKPLPVEGYNILPMNPDSAPVEAPAVTPAETPPPVEERPAESPAAPGPPVVHAYDSKTGKAFSGPDTEGRYNKDKWEGATEDPFGFRKKARIWQEKKDEAKTKFNEFIKHHADDTEYINANKKASQVSKRTTDEVAFKDWKGTLPPLIYRDNHWLQKPKWEGDQHTGEEVPGRQYFYRKPPPAKSSSFPEPEKVPIFIDKLPTLAPLPDPDAPQ